MYKVPISVLSEIHKTLNIYVNPQVKNKSLKKITMGELILKRQKRGQKLIKLLEDNYEL